LEVFARGLEISFTKTEVKEKNGLLRLRSDKRNPLQLFLQAVSLAMTGIGEEEGGGGNSKKKEKSRALVLRKNSSKDVEDASCTFCGIDCCDAPSCCGTNTSCCGSKSSCCGSSCCGGKDKDSKEKKKKVRTTVCNTCFCCGCICPTDPIPREERDSASLCCGLVMCYTPLASCCATLCCMRTDKEHTE
jgi:hypothetical protein